MLDKKQPKKTPQQLAEIFLKEYNVLCKKHGYRITTNPAFQARDDNTFSIVLQTSVGLMSKE